MKIERRRESCNSFAFASLFRTLFNGLELKLKRKG